MDDTVEDTSIPPSRYRRKLDVPFPITPIIEEPLKSHQKMITNQLRNLEQELTLKTHALYHLINETQIQYGG